MQNKLCFLVNEINLSQNKSQFQTLNKKQNNKNKENEVMM